MRYRCNQRTSLKDWSTPWIEREPVFQAIDFAACKFYLSSQVAEVDLLNP